MVSETAPTVSAVLVGWILTQLKWDHMLPVGIGGVVILVILDLYRYNYAREHKRQRGRAVAPVAPVGPGVDVSGNSNILGGGTPGGGTPGDRVRKPRHQKTPGLENSTPEHWKDNSD